MEERICLTEHVNPAHLNVNFEVDIQSRSLMCTFEADNMCRWNMWSWYKLVQMVKKLLIGTCAAENVEQKL